MTTLHRIGISLNSQKKELSAHTIASFLVMQGVEHVSELRPDRPMNKAALRYVNDSSAINHWLASGRIRIVGETIVLMAEGIRECAERESGEARDAAGRRKKECVSPELVRLMRDAILHGHYHDASVTFEPRDFDLGLR
jgi:hypothetical protein